MIVRSVITIPSLSFYSRLIGVTLMIGAHVCAAELPALPGDTPINDGSVGAADGPVWGDDESLYFTNERQITRRDKTGKLHVFREPSNDAGGLLFDFQGRLVICEAAGRRVIRLERNGAVTILADGYKGRKLNSPNDLTIDSEGRIYFSDPRYGSRDGMEIRDERGRTIEGVYRIDAPGKVTRVLGQEIQRANGLAISPHGEFLYVADNNNDTVRGARKLWRFRLKADGIVDAKSQTLLFDWGTGRGPDGLKLDEAGRLYVTAGLNNPHPPVETADRFKGGVYVMSPEGNLIQFIHVSIDEVTNCAFGDHDLKTLFITAGGTLWHIRVTTPGMVHHKAKELAPDMQYR